MRILIIGGTRFMGPYVLRNLLAAGHEVSIFHRGQTRIELPAGVRELLGDRDHLPDYAGELKKLAPDVVLDMIIEHDQHAHNLVNTFAGVARRVVMISSMDVYRAFGRVNGIEGGEIEPPPLTEESPLRTKLYPYRGETPHAEDDPKRWYDDYDKIPAEHVIMSQPELAGTILRLPAVYGPHDGQHRMFLYLKHMLDERPAILLEEDVADWRWNAGYVEDVADAIALAVTSEQASGRVYNVGEPFAHSQREQVERIANIIGWHGRIVALPTERVPAGLRWGINAAQHIIADTSRIRHELGYSERIHPEEALRRTLAWEKDNPPAEINSAQFDYSAEDKALAGL